MADKDQEQLRRELIGKHPEQWVRHHLASFPPDYFHCFDAAEVSRHLEALRALSDERPVRVLAEPAPGKSGVWRVAIVGYDAFQFLSTLCTLLAVRGLSIQQGWVFTSQPPPPATEPGAAAGRRPPGSRRTTRGAEPAGPDRRPRIVDVFFVRPARGQAAVVDWDEFQAELAELTGLLRVDRYEEVHHRLIRRFVTALGPYRDRLESLQSVDLELNPEGSKTATRVRIRTSDSFGFLSLTASALALCGIRIVQAEIRTDDDRIDDVLWVTDRWGRKIAADSRLRELRLSLILIEHFSSRLPWAMDPESALVHFSRFATETMARPDWFQEFEAIEKPEVLDALVQVLGQSHFLWEDYLHAQPENILPIISDPTEWMRPPGPKRLASELAEALSRARSQEQRPLEIRRFRDREVFRADLRSILGLSRGQEQFSAELGDVAEAVLRAAFTLAMEQTRCRFGALLPKPEPAAVICALGKFGSCELGFASDLEVMIVYDDRPAAGAARGEGAGSFFDHVVAALRSTLNCREGHTFDLDFRLRPYGRAGAPATSITTFLDYYRVGGQAWSYERQALIRLRVIAGDAALGREVEAHRDRFVYGPEPFDLEGLRRIRRLQVKQLVQPGTINAKYSPGALVDVEYFVQALQIAHGAADAGIRASNTRRAIQALGAAGRLTREQVATLSSGYQFFRALIDALRVVRDRAGDLAVPPFGSDEFVLLARRRRAADPEVLRSELERRLRETRLLTEKLEEFVTRRRGVDGGGQASR